MRTPKIAWLLLLLVSCPKGPTPEMLAEAHYYRGLQYQRDGDAQAAVVELRQAVKGAPKLVKAEHALGQAWLSLRQGEEAESAFRAAIALEPKKVASVMGLGQALRLQRRFKEAEAVFRSATLLSPKQAETYSFLADSLRAQSKIDEAIKAYEKAASLVKGRQAVAPLVELASILEDQQKFGQAAAAYKSVITAAKQSNEDQAAQLKFLVGKQRVEEAARMRVRAKEGQTRLFIHYGRLGDLWIQAGDKAQALEAFRKGLEVKPDDAASWEMVAALQSTLGKFGEAHASYQRAATLEPKRLWPHLGLAELAAKQGQLPALRAQLAAAIERLSDDAPNGALMRIAKLESKLGEFMKAAELYGEVVRADAKALGAWVSLAEARMAAGEKAAAEVACVTARRLKLDGGHEALGVCTP